MAQQGTIHQSRLRMEEEAVVHNIGIGLQMAAVVRQKLLGSSPLSRRRKESFLLASGLTGVSSVPVTRTQHKLFQLAIQRLPQLRRLTDPSAHRPVWYVHPPACQHLSAASDWRPCQQSRAPIIGTGEKRAAAEGMRSPVEREMTGTGNSFQLRPAALGMRSQSRISLKILLQGHFRTGQRNARITASKALCQVFCQFVGT
jgi:hypothetical protein